MPPPSYVLDVEIVGPERAVLRLSAPARGRALAREVRLPDHPASLWEGLFDTRGYLDRYADSLRTDKGIVGEAELFERIGVFLGRDVLGPELMRRLASGLHRRHLLVHLPQSHEHPLAAAFARVPWEIARPQPGQATLAERNLSVRLALSTAVRAAASGPPTAPAASESVRVLQVFAEPPGSRPLAMRQERESLRRLFEEHLMPRRRVQVDVLCHGVTRAELEERVRRAQGYHIVHWSGHGHQNLLALWTPGGDPDPLTGEDLAQLLAQAGGFVPRLVFLNCCLSGTLVGAGDWPALRAAWTGSARRRRVLRDAWSLFDEPPPGYAGSALGLLRVGVPAVIAMRYEVGDAYARDLAGLLYRRLLAGRRPRTVASALAAARRELLRRRDPAHDQADHATPVLFGVEDLALPVPEGPSEALLDCQPRPQPLLLGSRDLDAPRHFVGRTEELAQLRAQWLAPKAPAVTVIQGLAGLGKTALAAEAVHLWHHLFEGVLAFQGRGAALDFDDFVLRVDQRLAQHSPTYRRLCERQPLARVFLSSAEIPEAESRDERTRHNFVAVLRAIGLLLVLDNFETQLTLTPEGRYVCADRRWDTLLTCLAGGLQGTRSRLLITSRSVPECLTHPAPTAWQPLGPLPVGEAALIVEAHPDLRQLASGADERDAALVERVLQVSRGHPLLLDRLARLASAPLALAAVLDQLESRGLHSLPDVFAGRLGPQERARERAYLDEVVVRALDLALERTSAAARRLLWIVSLASESVPADLASALWEDGDERAPAQPLVRELLLSGLLVQEEEEQLGLHELVRERISEWMRCWPRERGSREAPVVWKDYGERYASSFEQIALSDEPRWRAQAPEQGRRALTYLLRAGEIERLDEIGRLLVVTTDDSEILSATIALLTAVSDGLAAGRLRRRLQTSVAEAEDNRGRPDRALALFAQAAAEAEAAGEWAELADIQVSHGHALRNATRLDDARRVFEQSAQAAARAGATPAERLGSEIEVLRIDVMQGRARDAWPAIATALTRTRALWRSQQAGAVVDAPSGHFVAQVHAAALDVARFAKTALGEWQSALALTREGTRVQAAAGAGDMELARGRFREHACLLHLGRLDDAQAVAEECLAAFREEGDVMLEARALSALAEVFGARGDHEHALAVEHQALALHSRLPELAYRSLSHAQLADNLAALGAQDDADRHRLAAAVYAVVAGHTQYLAAAMANFALRVRAEAARGHRYDGPRLRDLLGRGEFAPLALTLEERGRTPDELQATLEEFQALARSQADASSLPEASSGPT